MSQTPAFTSTPLTAGAPVAPRWLLWLAAILAAALPGLLAHNLPPSATLLNQCVAVASWGGFLLVLAPPWRPRGTGPLLIALGLLAAAVLLSWGPGALPSSLALAALGLLTAATLLMLGGAAAAQQAQGAAVFAAFAGGLLITGVAASVVAVVQVFQPEWADGVWIAVSGLPGRAVGNLRQPNHLCSQLLWAVIAAVALHQMGRLSTAATAGLLAALVFAVELSASRTGAAGLVLMLLWALLDRRLSRAGRWLLLAAPVLYALFYAAMAWWGDISHQALGAEARLAADAGGTASPNSRPNIWRNALALIAQQPWRGVGFGEFNFAWTLTPFPGRPTAFFDHTHNFELQLAVELGLPLALLVCGLLAWSLWRGGRQAFNRDGEAGVAGRAALCMVLMIGLHSQVEYPLWYAYFLLPAAFAWGFLVGGSGRRSVLPEAVRGPAAASGGWAAAAGLMLVVGGAAAVVDYQRVVVIYAPGERSGPLDERIAAGQRSVLFAHHADYAAATNEGTSDASQALGFARATHQLLDTRLMVAWARWLDQHGRTEQARTVAAQVAEFGHIESRDFFDECKQPGGAGRFQCQAPTAPVPWRAFLAPMPAAR